MTGPEQVLINDWCQQFPSHSVGDLAFGADGALYVSGGDGASFNNADYGQFAGNPCGDPPVALGGTQTAPDRRGRRAPQPEPATAAREPRVARRHRAACRPEHRRRRCPATRLPRRPTPTPGASSRYGLRNPFRFAIRPGTGEIWLGDVGLGTWEEINRIVARRRSSAANFGWPCYEGAEPPVGLPSHRAEHLQWSLRAAGSGDCAVLHLPALRQGRPGRELPDRQLVDHGHRLLSRRRSLPVRIRRGAVLRRLLAQLHLGHAAGRILDSQPESHQDLRLRGRESRGPPGRPRRQPLLRRPRGRDDPAHHLRRRQPEADRGGPRDADLGRPRRSP